MDQMAGSLGLGGARTGTRAGVPCRNTYLNSPHDIGVPLGADVNNGLPHLLQPRV